MITTSRCPACGGLSSLSSLGSSSEFVCRCEPSTDSSFPVFGPAPLSPEPAARAGGGAPERVGKYQIVRPVGLGGFGAVYEAIDQGLQRRVALKVAHPEMMRDPGLRARFIKEGRAAARVEHKGIVRVHDADTDGTYYYIASEFLDGRTLREILEGGPLDLPRAVQVAIDLAMALAHAHAAGVVHRDVKPSNVMITNVGDTKLIDFGLARLDASGQTRDCAQLGTPVYMSPEQAEGRNDAVGPASDQYSLGVILYEMLCGRPPFKGDNRQVMYQVVRVPVPGLREHDSSIPAELEAICLKALAKSASERHASCRHLAAELQHWLDARISGGAAPGRADAVPIAPAGPLADASLAATGFEEAPDEPGPGSELERRDVLYALFRLAAERAAEEERIAKERGAQLAAAQRRREARLQASAERFAAARQALLADDQRRRRQREDSITREQAATNERYRERFDRIASSAEALIQKAKDDYEWTSTAANGVLEAKQNESRDRWQENCDRINAAIRDCKELAAQVAALGGRYRHLGLQPADLSPRAPRRGPASLALVKARLARARGRLQELADLPGMSWPFVLVKGRASAAAQVEAIYRPLCRDAVLAHGLARRCLRDAMKALPARLAQLQARYDTTISQAEARRQRHIASAEQRRDALLEKARRFFEVRSRRTKARAGAEGGADDQVAELERQHGQETARVERAFRDDVAAADCRYQAARDALADRWRRGIGEAVSAVDAARTEVDRINPPWEDPAWRHWSPPAGAPPAIRFGRVRVEFARIPQGIPRDEGMRGETPDELSWPALLHLARRSTLLIETPPSGRGAAVRVLQAVMMRLLTSMPVRQARMTIIDPVGLGTDFGSFLHLADHEDLLGPAPILREPPEIEQALEDLCGHVEKIIQSYLRDDHPTIKEFNARAGELAEPYRILVICDFPSRFDQVSCGRLAQIITHGARSGVLTLVVADPSQSIPPGITLRELAAQAVRLAWRDGQLVWDDPDFGPYPLEPEPVPPQALARHALRLVVAANEAARRVEVPFDFVAPHQAWWSSDSRAGLEVALGKAGPTKAQCLSLGRNTAQHVLVAGRTGSGKSSLLHVLITNLALHYSPEEAELYLIDFKKGVEFKSYATLELPHARVVAIESEREFGLSVLARLDDELKERGERFRAAGVHDLPGYRRVDGLPLMPRILLVVDEFQEFFVEDDAIAREASLLLDRLIRQGRAFGIHVLLGSQSLSGAYSLARSTLEQMAVRIALQCGETDAHLILGEQNGAARLLSRPGEAIYNDGNGRAERNHFFQVVWLPEDRRDEYLGRIRDLARRRGWQPPRPQVVFEGDAAALLPANLPLQALLAAPDWPPGPRQALAWLGDSVAIKDPTAACFRGQSRDHLLIMGQDGEAAVGVLASALISLASQFPAAGPSSARFSILDAAPDGAPWAGALHRIGQALPHEIRTGGRHDAADVLTGLAEEVRRRQEGGTADAPALFLFLSHLGRFPTIRRGDDLELALGRGTAGESAALELLLREGPPLGVYVLAWCDGLTNLNRALGRAAQQEFGARVALQMGASDSVQWLDTPAAGRLGPHRALFLDEERGLVEKFRPYGLPPAEWLARVQDRLRARRPAADPGGLTTTPRSAPGGAFRRCK